MITIVNRNRKDWQPSQRHDSSNTSFGLGLYFNAIFGACCFVLCTIGFYMYLLSNDAKYTNQGQSSNEGEVEAYLRDLEFQHSDSVGDSAMEAKEETRVQDWRQSVESDKETAVQKWRHSVKSDKGSRKRKEKEKETNKRGKLFAYYVLAPQCLTEDVLMKMALGDSSRLDVYVNCYSSLCYDNLKPHVTYILNTSTTWTSGRNMLYNYVRSTNRKYQYHIFLDDDVGLFYTEEVIEYAKHIGKSVEDAYLLRMFEYDPAGLKQAQMAERDGKSAWRTFEDDLLERSPAFATTNLLKLFGFESRTMQARHWERMCSNTSSMPLITTTFFIDALFIAYHNDAMPLLFPYTELYEKNWWVSAIIQTFRARELVYKQGMCNFKVAVLNKLHRKYPREVIPNDIIKRYIEKEAPELKGVLDHRYLNYQPFKKWQHNEDSFYADPAICTGPIKFPVSKYYKVKRAN